MKVLRLVLFIYLCSDSFAEFALPTIFPADRLAKKLLEEIKKNPDDAESYYRLGRVYYLAFHNQCYQVPAYWGSEEKPPYIPGEGFDEAFERSASWMEARQKAKIGKQVALEFAGKAVKSFEYAIRLDREDGLYRLGVASLQEEVAVFLKSATEDLTIPKDLASISKDRIYDNYLQAFDLSASEDSKLVSLPPEGWESIVSIEAAKACLRLGPRTEDERKRLSQHIEKVQKGIQTISITPILITPPNFLDVSEAIARDNQVFFDIEGLGRPAKWPWVKAEVGILVWDPLEEGKVESGRQLFGNYTWQMFWKDGFEPLEYLDDDSNGALEGDELNGLSVWRDRDSDGVSKGYEVEPLSSLGVCAIRVDRTETVDGVKCRRRGVLLESGKVLDLWDWVTKPVELTNSPGSPLSRE